MAESHSRQCARVIKALLFGEGLVPPHDHSDIAGTSSQQIADVERDPRSGFIIVWENHLPHPLKALLLKPKESCMRAF